MKQRIHYEGRRFRSVQNSEIGEVDAETFFEYHQEGSYVWATYKGGLISCGQLIARVDDEGALDMRYQHITTDGTLKTGICESKPEILPDGRLRLYERWRWTCGGYEQGESIVEEC